jgi:hypothetical protein
VKLLPRRNADSARTAASPSAASAASAAGPAGEAVTGPTKGRPTPKRRDSTVPRGPVSAPKTRKEAYARQKQATKAARVAKRTPVNSMTVAQRRTALKAGDPAVLPRRDQGPTRKLTRDWVDSHRMFSNYLLFLFPVLLISWLLPVLQLIVVIVFVGLLAEWWIVGRRLRTLSIQRFGTAQGGPMTIGFYAGSRAYLPRRWRLPAPQVQRGDEI